MPHQITVTEHDKSGATGPVASTDPYRCTGGHLDARTGLYKLGVRYLDPSTGRFTQTDPTRQEDNNYLYAQADPCNRVDPTGAASQACVGAALGTVALYGATSALIVGASVATGGAALAPGVGAFCSGVGTVGAALVTDSVYNGD